MQYTPLANQMFSIFVGIGSQCITIVCLHLVVFHQLLLPPPNGEGYVYISVCLFVCLFVCCLFVCLFVCLSETLWENRWANFHEIFRIGRAWCKEQPGIFGFTFNPWIQGYFFYVFEKIYVCLHHWEKQVSEFPWNFQQRSHMNDVEYFNPLNPGSIFLFSRSMFVSNMEKQVKAFSWNFQEMCGMTQEIIS